jgi:catechol 2,3-dioxygenase-like lactoylglutathione lyase family enzyme
MPKIIPGNHTAVFAARSEQDRIRKFYCDVLGCKARVKTDEVDRFQLEDVHFCFVWQNTAPDEGAFLKATWLELQTDKPDEIRQKMLDFGVKELDVPDPHFYFQAPGGQVFKLVGINEDLSVYEDSASSRPGSADSVQKSKQEIDAIGYPAKN